VHVQRLRRKRVLIEIERRKEMHRKRTKERNYGPREGEKERNFGLREGKKERN
jgi:hypothetical protein